MKPVKVDTKTLLITHQDIRTYEIRVKHLYLKVVNLLIAIPRTMPHSVGHFMTINTHPDGVTISPDHPAYTITDGPDGHYWGTWKPSGAVSGSVFFEMQSGELTRLDRHRLVSLVEYLTAKK